jgi:hypothetical protein
MILIDYIKTFKYEYDRDLSNTIDYYIKDGTFKYQDNAMIIHNHDKVLIIDNKNKLIDTVEVFTSDYKSITRYDTRVRVSYRIYKKLMLIYKGVNL